MKVDKAEGLLIFVKGRNHKRKIDGCRNDDFLWSYGEDEYVVLERKDDKMAKFKVGDKVVANEFSNERYRITNKENNWKGKVTKVHENYFSAKASESGVEFDLKYQYFDKLEEGENMKKSDLKSGAIVETRDGNKHILLLKTKSYDNGKAILVNLANGCYLDYLRYNEDLTHNNKSLDIMKICQHEYVGDNIRCHILKQNENDWTWERQEEVVMTISEIEEKLGIENLKIKKED